MSLEVSGTVDLWDDLTEMADKLSLGMTSAGVMEYIELSDEFGIVEMAPPQREELFPEDDSADRQKVESPAEDKEKTVEQKKPKKEKTIKKVKPPKPQKEPREIKLPTWIKKIGEFQESLFDGMDERSDESINNRG